ncbi:hypothetical protein ACFLUQ_01435 [Chloroflexota bacterium]
MKSKFIGSVVVILLALLLILALPTTSSVRAAGATKWQFNNTPSGLDANNEGNVGNFEMSLTEASGGSPSSVTVVSGKRAFWYMDQTAETDISFGLETWGAEVHAYVATGTEYSNIRVKVWKVNPADNEATELASGVDDVTLTTAHNHFPVTLTPVGGAQEIPIGWTIACSVEWDGDEDLIIGFNEPMNEGEDSWCESPCNDPGYPTPELSTIILMSLGLVTIIGFIYFRHRTAKAKPVG